MRPRTALAAAAALAALSAAPAIAGPVSGDLFYTTFRSSLFPTSAGSATKVHFDFNGTTLSLSANTPIHDFGTNNADGIAFASDGNLLIGNGTGNTVTKISTAGAVVDTASIAGGAAFHLGISPDGKTVYTAGLPGALSSVPLSPFSDGTVHTLAGDDTTVTQIAFDGAGNAYYTSSNSLGTGNFGTINLTTFTTSRKMENVPAAHGMAFDADTGTLVLSGA